MARILLVEDSPVQRRAIEQLLSGTGHQVEIAADGQAAWELLQQSLPDLVITDLRLPGLDGLSLVRRIRAEEWRLPVVVITEFGSEQVAAEALAAGATSYVPKTQLAVELVEVVDELITYVAGESGFERLLSRVRTSCFEFELDNDPALIPPLTDLLQQMIASICDLPQPQRLQVGVAFGQAVHNAMYRGNLEIPGPGRAPAGDPDSGAAEESSPWEDEVARRRLAPPYAARRIHITAEIQPSEICFRICDDGPGFDFQQVLAEAKESVQPDRAMPPLGRGLVLMQAFLDEIRYAGRGNEVILIKRCPPPPERPESAEPAAEVAEVAVERVTGRAVPPARSPAERLLTTVLATIRSVQENKVWPVTTERITIGRDQSCDVVVPHMDVSGHHCQLFLHEGWWFVADLRTKNGIRVNGIRVMKRRLGPGDTLSVARHKLVIDYDPGALGAVGPTPPPDPF
jgi:CheY-like chemotaxis protein